MLSEVFVFNAGSVKRMTGGSHSVQQFRVHLHNLSAHLQAEKILHVSVNNKQSQKWTERSKPVTIVVFVRERKKNFFFDVSPQLIRWQHVTVTVCSVWPWPKESQGCGGHLGSSFSLRHLQGVVTLGQLALDSKCGGDFSRRHQGCFGSNLHLDSNKADAATLLIFRMGLSGSPWKQLLPWLSSIRFSLDPYDDEFAITQAHQDVAVAVGEGEALDLNQKLQCWQGLQSARSGRERHKQFSVCHHNACTVVFFPLNKKHLWSACAV